MLSTKTIYIALFRGINVGGNNLIDMKQLKACFETLGLTHIVTYINSGNVVFRAPTQDNLHLSSTIELAVKNQFHLDLKILVKSFDDIHEIASLLPDHWVKDKTMRTDVMFLWEEFDSPETVQLMQPKVVDNLLYVPGALIWNILDKDYALSGMLRMIGTKLYKNMTIRNVNTFRKIYQIMKDIHKETQNQ